MYGCEVWSTDNSLHKVNVAWNNCFRRIFSWCWRESTRPLQFFCNTASLTYTQLFVNKSIPYLQPIAIIIIIIITDLYSAFRSENTEARICSGAVWTVHIVLNYLNSAFCTKILTYAGPLGVYYKRTEEVWYSLSNSTKRFVESSYSKQR